MLLQPKIKQGQHDTVSQKKRKFKDVTAGMSKFRPAGQMRPAAKF